MVEDYPTVSKTKKVHYPELHINMKDLPEIKNWETGKTYTLTITVKQLTKNETHASASYSGKGSASAGFEILDIKAANPGKQIKDLPLNQAKKALASQKRKDYPLAGA